GPRHVDGGVDDEAGRVDVPVGRREDGARLVHLDQRRGGDLVEEKAVRVYQEGVFLARHAGGDMRAEKVGPAEMIDQPIGGGEVHAGLPLGLGALLADVGLDVHGASSSTGFPGASVTSASTATTPSASTMTGFASASNTVR